MYERKEYHGNLFFKLYVLILVAGGAEIAKNETMQGGEARNGEYWKGCN